jgi:hypothetical protein
MMASSAFPLPGPAVAGNEDGGGEGAGTVVSVSGDGVAVDGVLLVVAGAEGEGVAVPPPGEQAARPATDTRTST